MGRKLPSQRTDKRRGARNGCERWERKPIKGKIRGLPTSCPSKMTPCLPLFFFLSLFLLPVVTTAGTEESRPLSVADCVRLALENSPTMEEPRLRIEMAEAKLAEARGLLFPLIAFSADFGVVPEARGNAIFSPDSDTGSLSSLGPFFRGELSLVQPLYTFGKGKAGLKAGRKGLAAAQEQGRIDRAKLVYEIRKLYGLVLLASSLKRLTEDAGGKLNKALRKAQNLFDAENPEVSQQDLAKLKLFAAKVEAQTLEAETAVRLSRTALTIAVGLEDVDSLTLAERRLRRPRGNLLDLETYTRAALDNRPELQALLAGIKAREALVTVQKRLFFPDLFVGVKLRYGVAPNREDQSNPFVKDDFNFFNYGAAFGLRLKLPLKKQLARLRIAELELEKLQCRYRLARVGIELEIEKAFWKAREARGKMKSTRKGLKAARGWMVSENQLYEVGTGSTKDLLESLAAYAEAKKDSLVAIQRMHLALAEIDHATGRDPDFLEQVKKPNIP